MTTPTATDHAWAHRIMVDTGADTADTITSGILAENVARIREEATRDALEAAIPLACPEWCGQGDPARHIGAGEWVHDMDVDEPEMGWTYCVASALRSLMTPAGEEVRHGG